MFDFILSFMTGFRAGSRCVILRGSKAALSRTLEEVQQGTTENLFVTQQRTVCSKRSICSGPTRMSPNKYVVALQSRMDQNKNCSSFCGAFSQHRSVW